MGGICSSKIVITRTKFGGDTPTLLCATNKSTCMRLTATKQTLVCYRDKGGIAFIQQFAEHTVHRVIVLVEGVEMGELVSSGADVNVMDDEHFAKLVDLLGAEWDLHIKNATNVLTKIKNVLKPEARPFNAKEIVHFLDVLAMMFSFVLNGVEKNAVPKPSDSKKEFVAEFKSLSKYVIPLKI